MPALRSRVPQREVSMAIDRRKVLDEARRLVGRGARERALAQYEVLLRAEPSDARLRLEMGDALRRWGDQGEAIAQYARAAEQYRRDGFEARAVAVWKRVLELDEKKSEAHASLSGLYQELGMSSQAGASLKTAVDLFDSEGRKHEALALLRQACEREPEDSAHPLAVAEWLARQGQIEDAQSEYEAAAALFEAREDWTAVVEVHGRMLALRPDRPEIRLALARIQARHGAPQDAVASLEALLELDSGHVEALAALAELFEAAGDTEGASDIRRRLTRIHRARGDEVQARENAQRLPPEIVIESTHTAALSVAPERPPPADFAGADESRAERMQASERRAPRAVTDLDARFRLGVAYFEMGLVDAAIVEFEAALERETLRVDSLEWLARCSRARAEPGATGARFERTPATGGLAREGRRSASAECDRIADRFSGDAAVRGRAQPGVHLGADPEPRLEIGGSATLGGVDAGALRSASGDRMIQDLFNLEGRVAIVTAASRGIGAGIAKALAEAGADVVIGARNAEALDEVADAIASTGRQARVVAGDLRTRDGMHALVQAAEATFGRIDVVVNNAGGSRPSAFLETSEQAFNSAFAWNVTTAFNLTQLAVPRMLAGGGGSVINIASAAGRFGARGFVAYGTAKAAMIHMTRNLAEDLAPRIRVNAIAPGSIETDALAPVVENPAIRDEMLRRTPLGRLGRVEDIAAGALLLASDAGSYITGRVLDIDGGIHGSNLDLGIGNV